MLRTARIAIAAFVVVCAVAVAGAQTPVAAAPAAAAPDLVGTWRCQLDYQGGPIAVGIHITKDDQGKVVGSADSIDGQSPAMPVQVTTEGSDTVHLFVSGVEAAFTGKLNAAKDTIDGAWTVGDANLACALKKDK